MLFKRFATFALITIIACSAAQGETVWLKGGRIIEGTILRESSQEIEIKTDNLTLVVPRDQIERTLRRTGTPTAVPTPAGALTTPAAAQTSPTISLVPFAVSKPAEIAVTPMAVPIISGEAKPPTLTPATTQPVMPQPIIPSVSAPQPKRDMTAVSSEELRAMLAESLKGRAEGETSPPLKMQTSTGSPFALTQAIATAMPPVQASPGSPIPQISAPQNEEFRAIYLTRFEWTSTDATTLKPKIADMLERIKQANFNVVIFDVRGQGDVLYRSDLEPWSPIIGAQDPGFDPLAFAIEEAHSRGLQLHAATSLFPVWQGSQPPPARGPVHPLLLHCQDLSSVNWLCCLPNAVPMDANSTPDKTYWLSPGIPEVQSYLRKVVLDVVKRYNVDGIHLNEARYPGSQFSHDKVSAARFQGTGNPDAIAWEDWQRQQINLLIHNIGAEIHAEKPNVFLSAAAWGIYDKTAFLASSPPEGHAVPISDGRNDFYQDAPAWLKDGSVDAIIPMIYSGIKGTEPHFDNVLKDFVTRAQGKRVIPLISPAHAGAEWQAEIELARRLGSSGVTLSPYSALTQGEMWEKLPDTVFAKPARAPQVASATSSNTGIITGYVIEAESRKGIEDCIVEIQETSNRTLSSGDGFFAFLGVQPAEDIAVLARREDVGSAIASNVALAPNESKRITVTIIKTAK